MVAKINSDVESTDENKERERLEKIYGKGQVWNTKELQAFFKVLGFAAPFCIVEEKSTGKKGVVGFQHAPRFYFQFVLEN